MKVEGKQGFQVLSRGARECLQRLRWYQRRYGRVHPRQKKLAAGLNISDRQLRTHLAELRRLGFLTVNQGGGGRSATYVLNSGLCSGKVPGCFQAGKASASDDLAGHQSVTSENFRADEIQSRNSSISSSDQSECKGIGATARPSHSLGFVEKPTAAEQLEPKIPIGASRDEWSDTQRAAVARQIEVTGIKATPELIRKLARKAQYYRVNGFRIAADIKRAWDRIASQPSNHPRGDAWFLTVVENALGTRSASRRKRE